MGVLVSIRSSAEVIEAADIRFEIAKLSLSSPNYFLFVLFVF